MKRYDEFVLQKLMDQYENSSVYTRENQRNRWIRLAITEKNFPEYFNDTLRLHEVIHEQLEALELKGLISLQWKNQKKGHILEKCTLNLEKVEEIYGILKRRPKKEKEGKILLICSSYEGKDATLDAYLQYIRNRVEQGESVAHYLDLNKPGEFEEQCRLLLCMLTNEDMVYLREFSVRNLGDSKTAEKEIHAAASILGQFSPDGRFTDLDEEQVLEECLIYRNPSWIYFKGKGQFACGASEITLKDFPEGIGFPVRDMEQLVFGEVAPDRIVTIENLTSFHRWQDADTLAIYLGGYHNRDKRRFLMKLHEAYPDTPCFHFGDIDCGGFYIWKDLCKKTDTPFCPLQMDEETYLTYLKWGKPLTDRDQKELKKMMEDPFFESQVKLFQTMLEKGVKLEQEVLYGSIKSTE